MCSQDAANAISDPLILKNFRGDASGSTKEPLSMSPPDQTKTLPL